MTGNFVRLVSAIVAFTTLAGDVSGDELPNLAELQDAVWANLDAVEDLRVVVDVHVDGWRPRNEQAIHRFEWVFRNDGATYFVRNSRTRGEEPGAPWSRMSFDGDHFRSIWYSREAPYLPVGGRISPPDDVYRNLTADACFMTEFGRAWGYGINNKSIGEWLQSRGARVAGHESVNGSDCVVVEAPAPLANKPDAVRYNRFYLAESLAFGLVGWDTVTDGAITFKVRGDDFEERIPGVWFPMTGSTQTPERPHKGPTLPTIRFEVISLKCNRGIPDEAFHIEFEEGLPVYDETVPFPRLWKQGFNRSADILRGLAPELYEGPPVE